METYASTSADSDQVNETNDCMVKAFAIAYNIKYSVIHEMAARHGRPHRSGTPWYTIESMMKEVNPSFSWDNDRIMPRRVYQRDGRTINGKYTTGSINKFYPKGTFIMFSRSHATTMVDGVVEDWSANRRKQINFMYQVK